MVGIVDDVVLERDVQVIVEESLEMANAIKNVIHEVVEMMVGTAQDNYKFWETSKYIYIYHSWIINSLWNIPLCAWENG